MKQNNLWIGRWLLSGGAIATGVALIAAPGAAADSYRQAWPAFALVAGLIAIGYVANADGVFAAVGARLARVRGGSTVLFVVLMLVVCAVTVVLNLDTSVTFLTPVLIAAARGRRVDERRLLYGCVFMSNAASLLLPGSNLTNLIVLRAEHVTGAQFAARMLPAWVAAVVATDVALARSWSGPSQLLATASGLQTASIATLSALAFNNLPAAVLLSSHAPIHPGALLIGLDLGPNIAVTGSLSAYLWFKVSRDAGARPAVTTYIRVGALTALIGIPLAMLALVTIGRT